MTLKDFLNQAFEIEKGIASTLERIQKLRAIQLNTSPMLSQDGIQTSPDHDRQGKMSDSIIDLENAYQDDIVKLNNMKLKIKKAISELQNITYRNILEERYVNLKDWKEIAGGNGYSESRVFDFHKWGLLDLTSRILEHYFQQL